MHRRLGVRAGVLGLLLTLGAAHTAAKDYPVRGLVVDVDPGGGTIVVSHEPIAGLMEAMTMRFDVRVPHELRGIVPGDVVEFTLAVDETSSHATRLTVRPYATVEQDPRTARRLGVMTRMTGSSTTPVAIGEEVPDFTLINQARQPVALSDLGERVVVVNFIYTRCALPQFCLRMSNNFSALQKRFGHRLGQDLVLLTVTFDPDRDTPEVLADYAARWQANPVGWHFLTGTRGDVGRVSAVFGQEAYPDEGLMNHSLRTAVLDRSGRLVANIEGNRFTPEQLGDLVQAILH